MKSRALLGSLIALALFTGAQAQRPVVAITGALIVDGTGAPAYPGTVVIEGDRITAAGPDVVPPHGAQLVDATGQVLMPGLFDLHTHVTASGAVLGVAADWPKNLMAYLYCGVTSIADLGEYQENFDALRGLLASGGIEGPRVAFATRFSSPGGHGAEAGRPDAHTHEVLTPREAKAAMAEVLRAPKPDLIKIFTDGWRYGTGKDMTSMDGDTIAAIVDEAHRAGIPVITHTVTAERAKVAARAGADIIGHSVSDVEMDSELTGLMRSKGTAYVPTLAVYEPKGGRPLTPLLADVLDPVFAAKGSDATPSPAQRNRFGILLRNIAIAKEAHIAIAAGTDAGMAQTYHGWATLRELKLLVQGGMMPLEAITAATSVSARALRVDGDRGSIAPGKLADLVLVDGRPDQNIDDIEKIRAVYLGGRAVNRAALKDRITSTTLAPLPSPAAPATLDDFERGDGRAANGQLWVNYSDAGHDRSRMLWTRALRNAGNHALLMEARMGQKDHPWVEMMLPFAGGGLLPVDARAFRGLTFDARGEGAFRLVVHTRAVRDRVFFAAAFQPGEDWSHQKIDFSKLERTASGDPIPWTGDDLLAVGFELSRPPGETGWLEIDNVGLYK
jgi:imidazolonepropionase-like amidohydrolase